MRPTVYLVIAVPIIAAIRGERERRRHRRKPRELAVVSYEQGDRMLKLNEGWRLAHEEDRNRAPGMVCLERDI